MVNKLWIIIAAVFILSYEKSSAQGRWYNLDGGVACDTNIGSCYPSVRAICADTVNNVLYVGGAFNEAGNMEQVSISKWDGTKWDSLTERIPNVTAMVMYKGSLYVGIANVGFIVKFDGTNWINLPMVNGEVYCFTIYKDTLYAGGTFTTNDSGVTLNNIAKWSGTDWLPLGKGVYGSCCPAVNAMTVYNDTLFVGGYFTNAGTQLAQSIASWDGSSWLPLGSGIADANNPGIIFAMDTFNKKLYVEGDFDSAGDIKADYLASWNNVNWDSLPEQGSSFGHAIKSFDGYLFIPIAFPLNQPTEALTKFDGSHFTSVDSGVYGLIYSLAVWNGSLYVGGEFDTVGKTVAANHIAHWTPDTATGIKQSWLSKDNEQITIFPNPTSSQLTFINNKLPIAEIGIDNVLGQNLIKKVFSNGLQKQTIDVSTIPAGIYFYRLTANNLQTITGKFVKE